jgi:hypothetical protein
MITEDYILRMIKQLAYALASVLRLMKSKMYDEALEEVQVASKQMLGMDLRMLTTLSDAELIRLLSLGDRFDLGRCVVIAELLRVVGDIRNLQTDKAGRYHCSVTSLSLFLELSYHESGTLPCEYLEHVDGLLQKLSSVKLPLALLEKTFHYYEVVGRYDKAEDILFEVVEEDVSFVDQGMKFYGRLLQKSDEELRQGNLPREEVESSMRDLMERAKRV